MSTNYTPNYNLCQWEADDQVLRTDFNEDNAKIDAAIAEQLGPPEVIFETEIQEQGQTFDVDLSTIKWGQWSMVAVALLTTGFSTGEGSTFCSLLYGVTLASGSALGMGRPGPRLLLFFPKRNRENNVQFLSFPNGEFYFANAPFHKVTHLRTLLTGGGSIRNGSKVIIYGIR